MVDNARADVAAPGGRRPIEKRALRRATIFDVAARAGVSIGTVSHTLSGRRYVAPDTRARVELAIQELGYRRNRIASSLTLQRTTTIGMVIPDVANPFFGELVRGAEDVARADGYCVVFGNSDNDPLEEARYISEFVERRVDGLLVAVAAGGAAAIATVPAGCPIVALDRLPDAFDGDAVLINNQLGMELVVDHLVGLGHHQIGFVGGDPRLSTARDRRLAFEASLKVRVGDPAWVSEGAFSLESGRAQATEVFRITPRPSALVAANDLLALGILDAARAAQVRVPEELSVVGFDDIAYAALAYPPLTTVRQPVREMGVEAAQMLFRRLAGYAGPKQVRVLQPSLMVRESSAAARDAFGRT